MRAGRRWSKSRGMDIVNQSMKVRDIPIANPRFTYSIQVLSIKQMVKAENQMAVRRIHHAYSHNLAYESLHRIPPNGHILQLQRRAFKIRQSPSNLVQEQVCQTVIQLVRRNLRLCGFGVKLPLQTARNLIITALLLFALQQFHHGPTSRPRSSSSLQSHPPIPSPDMD